MTRYRKSLRKKMALFWKHDRASAPQQGNAVYRAPDNNLKKTEFRKVIKMKIDIDQQLLSVYPEIRLGVLRFQANVTESNPAFWEHMNNDILPKVREEIDGKEWSKIPGIRGSRAAYKAFGRNPGRYENEQKELAEKIKKLRSEIEKQSSRSMTTDMFIGLVRKYTRARKLTPRMLNELVEKIEVFNAEKIDGVWEQRLRIHYNCIGTIEIPTVLPLPIPEVSVNTRKGVVVNYAPCELAV